MPKPRIVAGIVDDITEYENGGMSTNEVIHFFGKLVKAGLAFSLQGSYGRQAQSLIEMGYLDKDGKVLKEAQDA